MPKINHDRREFHWRNKRKQTIKTAAIKLLMSIAIIGLAVFLSVYLSGCAVKKKMPALPQSIVFEGCVLRSQNGSEVSCDCNHIVWAIDAKDPKRKIAKCTP